jgi:large subunit ribosomal protein L23
MENLTRNLGDLLSLIKYPLINEKSLNLYGNQQYTFIVDKSLTKIEIKYIIEKVFNVTVVRVNTCMLPPKTKKTVINKGYGKTIGKFSRYKKTYIKLKNGNSISNLFN